MLDKKELALVFKEMEDFKKIIYNKFKDCGNRRDLLNVKSSWLNDDHHLNFLMKYYSLLNGDAEKIINQFIKDLVIIDYKNNLLKEIEPKVIKPKRYVEPKRITAKCGFCFNDYPIGEPHIEHTKYCDEADKLYLIMAQNDLNKKWEKEYKDIKKKNKGSSPKIKKDEIVYPTKDSPLGCVCGTLLTSKKMYDEHWNTCLKAKKVVENPFPNRSVPTWKIR